VILGTVRVEFFDVDGLCAVEMLGGKLFNPARIRCDEHELCQDIKDKVAILKTAGKTKDIGTVGRKVRDGIFYVAVSPSSWEKFAKKMTGKMYERR